MSDIRCSKCYGELDTGYVCRVCFNRERVSMDTSSDNTGTCTMGNGWCPLHPCGCPVKIKKAPADAGKEKEVKDEAIIPIDMLGNDTPTTMCALYTVQEHTDWAMTPPADAGKGTK